MAYCDGWRKVESGVKVTGKACQYKGIVVQVVVWIEMVMKEVLEEVYGELNVLTMTESQRWVWFGRRTKIDGVETNMLCKVFYLVYKKRC